MTLVTNAAARSFRFVSGILRRSHSNNLTCRQAHPLPGPGGFVPAKMRGVQVQYRRLIFSHDNGNCDQP
jgi:hypothetical protein